MADFYCESTETIIKYLCKESGMKESNCSGVIILPGSSQAAISENTQ